MDCQDHTAVQPERKRGQHLGPEERGAIKALKKQGSGVRAISRAIGCAPSTVMMTFFLPLGVQLALASFKKQTCFSGAHMKYTPKFLRGMLLSMIRKMGARPERYDRQRGRNLRHMNAPFGGPIKFRVNGKQ